MTALCTANIFIQSKNTALSDHCIEGRIASIDSDTKKQSKKQYYEELRDKIPLKAIEYFNNNIVQGDVGRNLQLFKFARLGNPAFVKQVAQTEGKDVLLGLVQELLSIPQLSAYGELVDKLVAELPAYMHFAIENASNWSFVPFPQPTNVEEVKCCQHKDHAKTGLAIMAWWKVYEKLGLPTWGALVNDLVTMAPSSAAVERLFSLFRNKFDKQMFNSKQDYIESSLMLHYNEREIPL